MAKIRSSVGRIRAGGLRLDQLVDAGFEFNSHGVRTLKALFAWAVDYEHVDKNYFRKIKPPPDGQRQRVATKRERAQFLLACTPMFRRYVMVMMHTIARPGEIRTLTWSQVRWDERCIRLHKFKGQSRRKEKAAYRDIPLDDPTFRLLANMRRRAKRNGPSDHVFLSQRNGRPWSENAVRCAMMRAREASGIPADEHGERFVLYTLRHTGATEATEAGLPDRILADVMGHTTTRTTARYQHTRTRHIVGRFEEMRRAARSQPA